MDDKVNLVEKLAIFSERWKPKIVGRYNDSKIMVVKVQGEFVWHTHPDTDELFLVASGELVIQLRDGDVTLGPGDTYVVPRGVEHCPKAEQETAIVMVEPQGTVNTGDVAGARTSPLRELPV